jgi:L-asparaginase
LQSDIAAVPLSAALKTVLLTTGGTIAGAASTATDHVGYTAGALGAADLVAAVPPLQGLPLEAQRVAQLDSADMDHNTWQALALAVQLHLERPDVGGIVITHGTDTLEETAFFLHSVLRADKPVVFTAAMRPATALSADGPQNLLDAVTVARTPGVAGVLVVVGGRVLAGHELRKVHGYRVDAFETGDAGPLALVEAGVLRVLRAWPVNAQPQATLLHRPVADWPVVDIVTSHTSARGAVLAACVAAGARGVVLAGTGNGTVHHSLLAAARQAQAAGVVVWRSSRCLLGGVMGQPEDALPSSGPLSPFQARVALMLALAG